MAMDEHKPNGNGKIPPQFMSKKKKEDDDKDKDKEEEKKEALVSYWRGTRAAKKDIEAGAAPNQSRPERGVLPQIGYDRKHKELRTEKRLEEMDSRSKQSSVEYLLQRAGQRIQPQAA